MNPADVLSSSWEVVKRTGTKEQVVAGPLTYSEAYREYEPLSAEMNQVDEQGNYRYPKVRISIRKVVV